MLKQLKTDIKLHKSSLIAPVVLIIGMFAVGMGMCALIMHTVDDPGSWFTMGTFMSLLGMVMLVIMFSFTMAQEFTLALSMGRTRKEFLASYALRTLLWQGLGYGLVLVLYKLELALGEVLYKQWPLEEISMDFLFDLRFIAVVLVGGNALAMFIGTLFSYFGKKVMVPMWFVWMAGCIFVPNVASAEPGQGGYAIKAALVKAIHTMPDYAWILLGVAVVAAMGSTAVCLGRKQMVK